MLSTETSVRSEELFAQAVRVTPGGVHSPVRGFQSVGGTPVFFRSGQGAFLESVEGDRYVDFCQSFGPLILGHRDPDVQVAVREAIEDIWTVGACDPYSVELATWITERIGGVEKVRFTSSGTEAVMAALRIARAATGREKVLKFEGCYHGHLDSLLVKAGSGLAGASAASSAGIGPSQEAQTVVVPLDDEAAFDAALDRVGPELAAVAIEPLPANNGLLRQREPFLQHVARRTREVGALLLWDEVITGFRVALGGMAETTGIQPDLVTYGKILGGGFPVGCFGGPARWMDLVAPQGPVYQAGTLSANPIGMRAGLATLRKVTEAGVHAILEARGARLQAGFEAMVNRNGIPLSMARVGSLFWMYPRTDPAPRRPDQLPGDWKETFARIFHALLRQKVFLAPNGFEVAFLGLAHTEEVLDEALARMETALCEVFATRD